MTRIQNYFNGVVDKIASSSSIANTAHHRPDIGTNREKIVKDFLVNHLPRRLSASLGGQIISHDGHESGQLDVVITNDLGVRFDENEKTFVTCESIAGVITVKSTLNKRSLIDALANLLTIPEPSPEVLHFKILKPGSVEVFLDKHPSRYVFSYDGVDGKKCLQYVKDFYRERPDIPLRCYPRGIIVNRKYMISFIRNQTTTSTGHTIPKDSFFFMPLEESLRGYPFLQLLNDLSSYADWLNHMHISIHPYFNAELGFPSESNSRKSEVECVSPE
ncbi:DUF6602 domain-containing protein [Nitrosomonas sp. Is24]|uniref:DUF6602 domain-containing protein n=1 Tax=Nitrosomonas sp. Is24 TaxID=3080533 RepID=UPI00294AA316|nr:DUF6602 domain-containing protein [Nitrosomonas sp. Is24]MDV6342285.1 DUF6602 domain-containing protein [Nitrosomonas sp. Is24]